MISKSNPAVELTILAIVKGSITKDKAVLVQFHERNSIVNQWIPCSCIQEWNPATKKIKIENWILDQKGVKYNV